MDERNSAATPARQRAPGGTPPGWPTFEGARYTEDVLPSLPTPIAIVGNATPKRAWGPVIDRYATVIRLNNFQTEGFETLVGRRIDVRCTSGWYDIEHRATQVEVSPFTASARESEHLKTFNAANPRPVLAAYADVKPFIPEVPNPSTGFALVQLLQLLDIRADLFGFDGFSSPHYWRRDRQMTPHHHVGREFEALLSRPHVAVYTELEKYTRDVVARAGELAAAADATWQWLEAAQLPELSGPRVLEVGGLGARMRADLERRGWRTTSIPIAVRGQDGPQPSDAGVGQASDATGGLLALAFLEPQFDCCVSLAVLDRLHPNDVRIFVRQAARVSPRLLVTVRAIDGSRSLDWWMRRFSAHFDVAARPCAPDGYYAIHGTRRQQTGGTKIEP